MRILRLGVMAVFVSVLLTGCLYIKVKAPYDIDLDETKLGDKIGTASNYSIVWLVAWGDAGTAKAAQNGNISIINHMDREVFSVLFGLYSRTTTIVYGD